MTKTQLLKATGNIWQVHCWQDGNRRKIVETIYLRASDVLRAESLGQQQSGRRCVDARPWNPAKDAAASQYIRSVANGGN